MTEQIPNINLQSVANFTMSRSHASGMFPNSYLLSARDSALYLLDNEFLSI